MPKTALDIWFQTAVLRRQEEPPIQCRPMVCPQIIDVLPSPVRHIRQVRQRYERLATEMASVLTDAIGKASWNSAHRDWLLDAQDACLDASVQWYGLKRQADHLRWELNSLKVASLFLYQSEERDVRSCISAIQNASRALRALEAAERHEYEIQTGWRSR
jgi:hypothetical protein